MLDPIDLWLNYPHIPLAGPFKFYYLSQTAFYLHQILILNAEARRKDHVQMMTHHIITVILMWTSYFTNFTRVGALIMVLMDWCDIFLPVSNQDLRHDLCMTQLIPYSVGKDVALPRSQSTCHRRNIWLVFAVLACHPAFPLHLCHQVCHLRCAEAHKIRVVSRKGSFFDQNRFGCILYTASCP